MTSWVCVDSNIALNLYLQQPLHQAARQWWEAYTKADYHFTAPVLFRYEVVAICRRNIYHGIITIERGREILKEILALPIFYSTPVDLHTDAFDLASQLNRPTAYDAHYLVVAQAHDCEFWTADRKLVNAASSTFPWVKWLGDYSPEIPTT